MSWIGYDEETIDIARSYAIVASISQMIENCASPFSALLEIEGYAKFNAIYDFWDSIITIVLCFFFMFLFQPSLLALGLFHCFLDITSTVYYMYLTYEKHGMFESYHEGMIAQIGISVSFCFQFPLSSSR